MQRPTSSRPADLLTPPATARTFTSPRGELSIWQPAPGVVVQKASGHANLAAAQFMVARLNAFVSQGRVTIYDDWQLLTSYDGDARDLITAWSRDNRARIEKIHILVGSRLVAMAITVANLVTDGVSKTYTNRTEFALEFARAVERPAP